MRRILIKLKINLSCGLDLLLFGICLNDWTWYFVETLSVTFNDPFTMAKKWKQHTCCVVDEWVI